MKSTLLTFSFLPLLCLSVGLPSVSHADLIYCIGNSLTLDTRPPLLDGTVEYHIDCGKNLQYIFDNPTSPCVSTSHIWPDALANTQYDWLTVQPYYGTTLDQDATVISAWMAMQPNANVVIHTGWPPYANFESSYHGGNPNNQMTHSPEYFADLIAELETRNPGRTIVSTHAIDVLDEIYHDIEAGNAPFSQFSDLYRDTQHMNGDGQYLVHNLMRRALGQPISNAGFPGVAPDIQQYLNSKINSVPEPSELIGVVVVGLMLLGLIRSRKMQPGQKAAAARDCT